MRKTAAVLIVFAVLFSFFSIPVGASAVRDYSPDSLVRSHRIPADFAFDRAGIMLDNMVCKFYYELRITLKRSIIFANIAN